MNPLGSVLWLGLAGNRAASHRPAVATSTTLLWTLPPLQLCFLYTKGTIFKALLGLFDFDLYKHFF